VPVDVARALKDGIPRHRLSRDFAEAVVDVDSP
jgi:hypothetical protein